MRIEKVDFLGLDVDKSDIRIVTKNKKKKEREAALKIKKATGARKKENPKGSETKVIEQFDYWLVNIFVIISLPFDSVRSLRYNLGGKTTICDGRAFRHDGDETLSGDGRGDQPMSATI